MNWTALLSIVIPSLIAVGGVVLSAIYIRRSSREANQNTANANETNSFKVVTDQLLADNAVLRGEMGEIREKVKELEESIKTKDATIEGQRNDMRQLARYIKRLLAHWPANTGTPPAPEPPFDWAKHL